MNYLNNWPIGSIKTNRYTGILQSSDMNPTISSIACWLIHLLKSFWKDTQRVRDVSILISMPAGLVAMVTDTVGATRLFGGNQDLIKVSVWYMFRQMGECGYLLEEVSGFMSSSEESTSLEEEIEQIRGELGGERFRN